MENWNRILPIFWVCSPANDDNGIGSIAVYKYNLKNLPYTVNIIIKDNTVMTKPPINVIFAVPSFTASGLHVRFLKVYEKSSYQTVKWVRYMTRSGDYQIRL